MNTNLTSPWLLWLALSLALAGYLSWTLLDESGDRTLFVPGKMSHGHYQIELACNACHTDSFGGKEVLQDACTSCHGKELKTAKDSHPRSKFTNPRNADRVEKLDARYCVTCHTEHRPGQTGTMGVSLPEDYCYKCHDDVEKERPSHKGLKFDSCASAGCHNYHDNRALYEDFLGKHLNEPETLKKPNLPLRNLGAWLIKTGRSKKPLKVKAMDAPPHFNIDARIKSDWLNTAHARGGINCTGCHNQKDKAGKINWNNKPDHKACMNCHESEGKGFLAGRHGMRLAQGLSPMTPAKARQPMRSDAHSRKLTCTSCHGAHRFETRQAAVQTCLNCHSDRHSLAYKNSPHYQLWLGEVSGQEKPGTGVSCATCHMPREIHQEEGEKRIIVQHNQNDNLRPNEKMIRSVCMNCHGLGFSINALADPELVRKNFKGRPSRVIPGLEWTRKRLQQHKQRKKLQ